MKINLLKEMYSLKSLLFYCIIFCSGYIFSQELDLRNVTFEKNKYEEIAKLELEHKFKIESKYIDSLKYLKDIFNLEDLKVYSIPIFKIKNVENSFINSIDFTSNPNKQRVIIENIINDKIVSEFNIDGKKFTEKEDEFVRIDNVLIYYKYNYNDEFDFPILIGGPYKYFFIKERLEKKYFRFDVVGFKGTFIIKNNKIFYATKKIISDKKIKKLSYEDEIKLSKTIYIEVDDNFLKRFKDN